jgi:hypothetical protein
MIPTALRRATATAVAALLSMAVPAATLAAPPASPPLIGSFPIGGQTTALEPESSLCGFDIAAESSGTADFQVFFDEAGDPIRIHVHAMSTGTLSANGITLRSRSSLNQFLDFDDSTVIELGLVFQNAGPGTGVALMDRGRLVWSVDPSTGDVLFPPVFEAGPHPQLHGDVTGLCEALSPTV